MDSRRIILRNLEIYQNLKPKSPSDSYTVLSTLNDSETGDLLALATGTQANLKTYPDDIEDCHAESLLKRAFKRYLIGQISKTIQDLEKPIVRENVTEQIKKVCVKNLTLFVSQFPCGLVKRYEGEEPIDSKTGLIIKRKPGRGTEIDGRVVYVDKDSCFEKIKRWSKEGLQGSRLKSIFSIGCSIDRLLIGDCESGDSIDYEGYVQILKNNLERDVSVDVLRSIRQNELVYMPDKRPQPVSIVWWKDPTLANSKSKGLFGGRVEFVVDGRRRGVTKQNCLKDLDSSKLKVSNHWIHEDIRELEEKIKEFSFS